MTVDELRAALVTLDGKLEVMVTMAVHRDVSNIGSVTIDIGSDVDTTLDNQRRVFLNCVPDGHEEE